MRYARASIDSGNNSSGSGPLYLRAGQKLVQFRDATYEELVESTLTEYLGLMFEIVCQNARQSPVPNPHQRIGYWWQREHELDIVGLGSDVALVAGK